MGNLHLSDSARLSADAQQNKWTYNNTMKWNYTRDRGPESWWVHFPSAAGTYQSPVDIRREEAEFLPMLRNNPLKFHYEERSSKVIRNNGHTCIVDVGGMSYITGGLCSSYKFKLKQFHFHWGDRDDYGSEHTINGKPAAAELHFTHWNCDLYSSYNEAAENENGLVVLAVLIKTGPTNENLSDLTDVIYNIQHKNEGTNLPGSFNTNSLLPSDKEKYWYYTGSLTTPPCTEGIKWGVFYDQITCSSRQLKEFRTLCSFPRDEPRPMDDFNGYISQNWRPPQPLNGRPVYTMEEIFATVMEFEQYQYTHFR